MKARHHNRHFRSGQAWNHLPRDHPPYQMRQPGQRPLTARTEQHPRDARAGVVPQALRILQARPRRALRPIGHQHPRDRGTGSRRCVREPARQRQNVEHRTPDTDGRTGTGTFQPAGTSLSTSRTATVLPRPGSPNPHRPLSRHRLPDRPGNRPHRRRPHQLHSPGQHHTRNCAALLPPPGPQPLTRGAAAGAQPPSPRCPHAARPGQSQPAPYLFACRQHCTERTLPRRCWRSPNSPRPGRTSRAAFLRNSSRNCCRSAVGPPRRGYRMPGDTAADGLPSAPTAPRVQPQNQPARRARGNQPPTTRRSHHRPRRNLVDLNTAAPRHNPSGYRQAPSGPPGQSLVLPQRHEPSPADKTFSFYMQDTC